jgi:hypothetical protein
MLAVLVRVVCSLVFAGIFYTGWMAVAIAAFKARIDSVAVRAILWLCAPIVTGAGFAVEVVLFELLPGTGRSKIVDIYRWSLIGCAIGAGVVVWFGPMLIVFGMFAGGAVSVGMRELVRMRRSSENQSPAVRGSNVTGENRA